MTTILFSKASASEDAEVLDRIHNAEALFMAGGDQSDYLNLWTGTSVQALLQSKLSTATVGGTSAGCMVLGGEAVYSGEKGSVTSEEALADPYHRYITIEKPFLRIPFLDTLITDTHFVTRDRMGRMLTFMARWMTDNHSKLIRGLGIDEHTALLLDVATGDASTVGIGTAYLCEAAHQPAVCEKRMPLTFKDLSCQRLDGKKGDTVSFASFASSGAAYVSTVLEGQFTNLPYGPK